MKNTWILIANSERARCFKRHAKDHSLTELADFVHPTTTLASATPAGERSGDAGKGHGRTGHAGKQFEPHTEAHAKERRIFAQQLADYVNEAVNGQRCSELVLIASSAILGELRPLLNSAADKAMQRSVASDLTSYEGLELKKRVDLALQLSN